MARINLLPWREAERQRRQRDLAVMAGIAAVATLLVGLGLHMQVERLISNQQNRNQYLQTQINELEQQIKEIEDLEKTKASLLARMNVIQELQKSRPEIVHLFDELVIGIPEGVYLTKLTQNGRSVVLEGHAQSNARVSAFMRRIEESDWIGRPQLLTIEHKDKTDTGMSRFRLRFEQLSVSNEDVETTT